MSDQHSVLFVCVHNAGRSQMAAGFLTHLGEGKVEVRSAGSIPGDQVNPAAVAAMAEVGIDISAQTPKSLPTDPVQARDVGNPQVCRSAWKFLPGQTSPTWTPARSPAGPAPGPGNAAGACTPSRPMTPSRARCVGRPTARSSLGGCVTCRTLSPWRTERASRAPSAPCSTRSAPCGGGCTGTGRRCSPSFRVPAGTSRRLLDDDRR